VIHRRAALAAPWLLPAGRAFAQAPSQGLFTRPLRLIATFGAGSTVDLMARALSGPLGEQLGQPVVVENRAGAGGNLGTEAALRATPDGHTLALATSGALAINPVLLPAMPFDVAKDVAPLSLVAIGPNLLLVRRDLPATDIPGLIALARARPGQLTYGSSGVGSSNHLAGALFSATAGVELTHVPYRGNADMANDLLAGRLDMVFSGLPPVLGLLRDGAVRALAVAGPDRVAQLPAVPTMAEAGLPGAEAIVFYGLVTAAGVPQPQREALAAAARAALAAPALAASFAALGSVPRGSDAAAFAALIAAETVKWRAVIERYGIAPG
jgi:tripartite-type tricarboxylate transporter receptor subunit TctC